MGNLQLISLSDDEVEEVHVSKKNRVLCGSTSKGNQQKWVKGNRHIKLDTWEWYESVSEVLVCYLLRFSSIKDYVEYFSCKVYEDGEYLGNGCYSYQFLNEGESCISFYRVLKNMGCILEGIGYDEVRDAVSDAVGFDIKFYLDACLCLDAITYNEDRHFNNLSVIKMKTGYRQAPIYDNGLACLSDVFTYPFSESLNSNLKKVYAKPFNTDFICQLNGNYITPIRIDADGFLGSVIVGTDAGKRALNVIKAGLKRTEGLAWERF